MIVILSGYLTSAGGQAQFVYHCSEIIPYSSFLCVIFQTIFEAAGSHFGCQQICQLWNSGQFGTYLTPVPFFFLSFYFPVNVVHVMVPEL